MVQKVQYCRCRINLAGQNCHTVIYDEYNPLTWPEVQVMMQLHGEENVMDIIPIGISECWPTQEKNRLMGLYGKRVVETCFPGRQFRMEYMMTDDENLPRYDDNGRMVTPLPDLAAAPPKPEPKPEPEPVKAPASDPPGTDHDDGEDDEPSTVTAVDLNTPLPPIFKPGRARPPATARP